ncbi:trace amine-associated receptor 13c-like, partial [Silurus meridionalis]|uniref:trace amine-associated receptor 13c-like n=1 Tax=Silurus meridionalis TaxID=175797 RepID=UPI001EECCC4C
VLLTVCGNMFIIISVLHFKQLHTPTNTLVFSLAVSDFLVGALVMPTMLIWMIESCWIFGRLFCLCFLFIGSFLTCISIYNIALIAVDRYVALSNPFLYIDKCFLIINEVWTLIDLVLSFIFPFSVIIILYSLVFLIAKKHATAIRELNNHTRPQTQKITSHSMKSERKAAKVLGILVSVFVACLLPYYIYSLLGDVIEIQADTVMKVLLILCLNSTINPFIYALFYPWFRKCIQLIITLRILHTDSALINIFS